MKQAGKQVVFNDLLSFNRYVGRALIENMETQLADAEVDWLLRRSKDISIYESAGC